MKQNTLNLTYEETIGKELEEQYKKVSDCETPILNIPIYRARKIDSVEYVEGYYQTETGTNVEDKNNMFPTLRHIIVDLDKHQFRLDLFGDGKLHDDSHIREQYEIDPTTLSIHFKDMLDSQGNKIFASLSEDGKGGDIVNLDEGCGENFNAISLYRYYEIHLKGGIALLNRAKYLRCYPKKDIKVIGIQE